MIEVRLDVFGRSTAAVRSNGRWSLLLLGARGETPSGWRFDSPELSRNQIVGYLVDIFREIATPQNNEVGILP